MFLDVWQRTNIFFEKKFYRLVIKFWSEVRNRFVILLRSQLKLWVSKSCESCSVREQNKGVDKNLIPGKLYIHHIYLYVYLTCCASTNLSSFSKIQIQWNFWNNFYFANEIFIKGRCVVKISRWVRTIDISFLAQFG